MKAVMTKRAINGDFSSVVTGNVGRILHEVIFKEAKRNGTCVSAIITAIIKSHYANMEDIWERQGFIKRVNCTTIFYVNSKNYQEEICVNIYGEHQDKCLDVYYDDALIEIINNNKENPLSINNETINLETVSIDDQSKLITYQVIKHLENNKGK